MKIENIDNMNVIYSDLGYFTNLKRDIIYDGKIYLGINDSPNNYIEINELEKNEIQNKLDEIRKQEELERESKYPKLFDFRRSFNK